MNESNTSIKERVQIGFFGCRNVGKSSLVNAITNQQTSIVSDVKGTTTDAVKKTMELLPIGPVEIIDTPGFDDDGVLGEKRILTTEKILRSCDIAILVTDVNRKKNEFEIKLLSMFKEKKIPYIIVKNKIDLKKGIDYKEHNIDFNSKQFIYNKEKEQNEDFIVYTSVLNNVGIEELKNVIGKVFKPKLNKKPLVSDLIRPNDIVVLVTPIDVGSPKGRIILPQQMVIRDIIDSNAIAIVAKETELENTLNVLSQKPALVITDSQVLEKVKKLVPKSIPLTSFSILMARFKGFLDIALNGSKKLDELEDGAKILICEGCTHHRQCEDIGTVKLPKWIREYTGKDFDFEWNSGNDFPLDLTKYDLVIHCGGCMLNSNEVQYRMNLAIEQGVSFTNYGVIIAYMQEVINRCVEII